MDEKKVEKFQSEVLKLNKEMNLKADEFVWALTDLRDMYIAERTFHYIMEKCQECPTIESSKPPQDYWTIKQTAKEFGYSIGWTIKMCQRGIIKAFKPYGGAWRIPASEVQRIRGKHLYG